MAFILIFVVIPVVFGGLDPSLPVYNPCPNCTTPGNLYDAYAADFSNSSYVIVRNTENPNVSVSAILFLKLYEMSTGFSLIARDDGHCASSFLSCKPHSGFEESSGAVCTATSPSKVCVECSLSARPWVSFYDPYDRVFTAMASPGPASTIMCVRLRAPISQPCRAFIPAVDPCDTGLANAYFYESFTYRFGIGSTFVTSTNGSLSSFSQYFARAMANKPLPADFVECPYYAYDSREFYGRSCHQYPLQAAKSISEYIATGKKYVWLDMRASLFMTIYAWKPYTKMLGKYCPSEIGFCFVSGLESYFVDNALMYSALWQQHSDVTSVSFDVDALFALMYNQHSLLVYDGYYVHSVASNGRPTYVDFVLNINVLGCEVDCILGHHLLPNASSFHLTDYMVGNWLRYDRYGRLISDLDVRSAIGYMPFVLFGVFNLVNRDCVSSEHLKYFSVFTSVGPELLTSNLWAAPFVYATSGSLSNAFAYPVVAVPYELQLRIGSHPAGPSDGYAIDTKLIAFQSNSINTVSPLLRATVASYSGYFCTWDPATNATRNRACKALDTNTFIVCSLVYHPVALLQYDGFYMLKTRSPVRNSVSGPAGSYFTRIDVGTSYTCIVNAARKAAVLSTSFVSGFASTSNATILYVKNISTSVYKPWFAIDSSMTLIFQPFNVTCVAPSVSDVSVAAVPVVPVAPYSYFEHVYRVDDSTFFATGFKYVQFPLIVPPFCTLENRSSYFNCATLACGDDVGCLVAVAPICTGMQPILLQLRRQMVLVSETLDSLTADFFSNFAPPEPARHVHARAKRAIGVVGGFVASAFAFLASVVGDVVTGIRIDALSAEISILQQQLSLIDNQVRSLSSQQIELAKIVDDRTTTLAVAVNALGANLQALATATASNYAVLSAALGDVADEVSLNRYLTAFSNSYLSTATTTLSQLSNVYVMLLQHKQTLNACAYSTYSGVLSTACVPLSSMASALRDIDLPAGCTLSLTGLSGYYSASLLAAVHSYSVYPVITVAVPYMCNASRPYLVYPRQYSLDGTHYVAPPTTCFKSDRWLGAVCSGGSCVPTLDDCVFDYAPTSVSEMALFTYLHNITTPCTVFTVDGSYYDKCDSAMLGTPTYGVTVDDVLLLHNSLTVNVSIPDLIRDALTNITFPTLNFTAVEFHDNLTQLQQQMSDNFANYEYLFNLIKPVGLGMNVWVIILLTISCFAVGIGFIMVIVLCCCKKQHRD